MRRRIFAHATTMQQRARSACNAINNRMAWLWLFSPLAQGSFLCMNSSAQSLSCFHVSHSPRVCPSSVDFISGGPLVKGRRQEKGRNSGRASLRLLTFSPSPVVISTSLVHPEAALPYSSMFMRGVFAQLVPFIFLCQYCTYGQSVSSLLCYP